MWVTGVVSGLYVNVPWVWGGSARVIGLLRSVQNIDLPLLELLLVVVPCFGLILLVDTFGVVEHLLGGSFNERLGITSGFLNWTFSCWSGKSNFSGLLSSVFWKNKKKYNNLE